MIPGEYVLKQEPIVCNQGRPASKVRVLNKGDRPVQVENI
jgi:urease subunit beta